MMHVVRELSSRKRYLCLTAVVLVHVKSHLVYFPSIGCYRKIVPAQKVGQKQVLRFIASTNSRMKIGRT
jgi:hypothetical protein